MHNQREVEFELKKVAKRLTRDPEGKGSNGTDGQTRRVGKGTFDLTC